MSKGSCFKQGPFFAFNGLLLFVVFSYLWGTSKSSFIPLKNTHLMTGKLLTTSFALLSLFFQATAQNTGRTCGTMENLEMLKQQDPELEDKMNQVEREMEDYMVNLRVNPDNSITAVITIPTVFHVVWNTAAESLSVSRLNDQLTVLNQDYRKTNTDASLVPAAWTSIAADCEVQFCLAQRDPFGAPTTGITYRQTTVTSFSTNNNVKYTANGGTNIWDRSKYLNIWVCDLGSGLLGYAQFPGGLAATDGVVCDYQYTGTTGASAPYNKGRTATHEVGHWLNLRHIWGDDGTACTGSDLVTDTPNQAGENYTCWAPLTVRTDACSPSAPGFMWMNYMDYTDDACMYMFTAGQKARVVACLGTSRLSLQTSNGCTPSNPGVTEYTTYAINMIPNPNQGEFIISSPVYLLQDCEVKIYNALGSVVKELKNGSFSEIHVDIRDVNPGVYFVELNNGTGMITKRLIITD